MKKLMQCSKSRQELLNNTVAHYNSTNRSVNEEGICLYRHKGNACAIGREISDEVYQKIVKIGGVLSGVHSIMSFLPKRLQDMGWKFLDDIQILHDTKHYWSKDGLSEEGKERVSYICAKYNLENPCV